MASLKLTLDGSNDGWERIANMIFKDATELHPKCINTKLFVIELFLPNTVLKVEVRIS